MWYLGCVRFRHSRSQWPSGLRRGSADALSLGLRFRIPPGAWMFVCCDCCVLSGRGLCDGPIPRPEESYRLWCVLVGDQVKNNLLHLLWLGRKTKKARRCFPLVQYCLTGSISVVSQPVAIHKKSVHMNSIVFWDVTQRRLVSHLRFGTTYRSHLQHLDTWRWDRHVVPKRRCEPTVRNIPEDDGIQANRSGSLWSRRACPHVHLCTFKLQTQEHRQKASR